MNFLSFDKATSENLEYAESLLGHFVKTMKELYGSQHLVHNVHNLLHMMMFDDLDPFTISQILILKIFCSILNH